MQSLSGRHLMRQQVPMVFLLPLVYLGIFEGSKKVKHYSQIATFYDFV